MHVGYNFFLSLLAGLRGGITIAGIAAAIKLMKHWYVNEQQRLNLEKENISTQLQLLKAQIHPHFLFNTLNNIYSYTQDVTPTGSRLVLGLSDILRYMLYETSQPLVPLAKEIKMLKDYLVLEKIRYDNKFEMNIDLPDAGAVLHLQIAPLLLLPFAENAFKHGASNIPDHPWVNIYAAVHEKKFSFKVVNGKPGNAEKNHEQGIGIKNVQQRLELLYPGRHRLEIHNEEDVFIVNLELELDEKPGVIVKERKNILIPHV
jgi:LytS/YehU family sensor histidine kinase